MKTITKTMKFIVPNFVIYTSRDEILVTTPELEKKMLKDWFAKNTGRSLDEYDKSGCKDNACQISPAVRCNNSVTYEWA